MTLTEEDIEYIKTNMPDWLAEQGLCKPPAVYEIEPRERMLQVEEGLRHQRELQWRTDRFLIWSSSTTTAVRGLDVSLVKL